MVSTRLHSSDPINSFVPQGGRLFTCADSTGLVEAHRSGGQGNRIADVAEATLARWLKHPATHTTKAAGTGRMP
jgi:hypothetical protein